MARDKELNRWCSVKKTCQYRDEREEMQDVHTFRTKKDNINLKKKVLPSIFAEYAFHSITFSNLVTLRYW